MEFIEVNESVDYENVDYENVGYVSENGTFEKASADSDDVTNIVIGNPPHNLVDNQSFYRDFSKKNPQQYKQPPKQQIPTPNSILKQSVPPPKQQKKVVTYDDILSSLNMKIINGKLAIIRGDDDAQQPPPLQRGRQVTPSFSRSPQPQAYPSQAYPSQAYPSQAYTNQHDIYNQFLQSQQHRQMSEMVEEEETEVTPEQMAAQQQYYKRLMMIQYIKSQQQRQRLGQIKSKKMKFV